MLADELARYWTLSRGHRLAKESTLEHIQVTTCTYYMGVYFDRGEIESLLMRNTAQRFSFYRKFFDMD